MSFCYPTCGIHSKISCNSLVLMRLRVFSMTVLYISIGGFVALLVFAALLYSIFTLIICCLQRSRFSESFLFFLQLIISISFTHFQKFLRLYQQNRACEIYANNAILRTFKIRCEKVHFWHFPDFFYRCSRFLHPIVNFMSDVFEIPESSLTLCSSEHVIDFFNRQSLSTYCSYQFSYLTLKSFSRNIYKMIQF